MSFIVIIPARFESSRLPGKPLMIINGKPMIYWTWQQAKRSGASRVIIATENLTVKDACKNFGAEVCLTGTQHESGTERIAEVIKILNISDDKIIVNVQGDEPMLPPELIHQVSDGLATHLKIQMATLCEPIEDLETLFDANAVKVSRDINDFAINFSRAALPWSRDDFATDPKVLPKNYHYKRHIGLYSYRAGFINRYVNWPACEIEKIEKLEQLRVLWQGEKILVMDAICDAGVGVDTQQDLDYVRQLMGKD